MTKRPGRLLSAVSAAITAMALAACWREEWTYGPGYVQFTPCPSRPEHEQSITKREEMVEIQREDHLESGVTLHLENPFEFLGGKCYVGSRECHALTLATVATARSGLCTGAEAETNSKNDSSHEQNQLEPLLA